MVKIIFILGGARSGKSNYAVQLAKKSKGKVAFVATGLPSDNEMKTRIQMHKAVRPALWKTFEEPRDLTPLLKKIDAKFNVVIIDCLTLLISNLLLDGISEDIIEKKIGDMMDILRKAKFKSIIVSNEVGMGLHPNNRLGRRFRDVAGRVNQMAAKSSDEVLFMVSGLPMKVKGE